MKKVLFYITFILLITSSGFAQSAGDYDGYLDSLAISQGTESATVYWALDTRATDGLDAASGVFENEGPPAPPSGLYARFPITEAPTGLIPDVRNYDSFPFNGSHTLTLEALNLQAGNKLKIDYPTGVEVQIIDKVTGTIFNETLSGQDSVELNSALTTYDFILTFTNFTPPAPASSFSATPSSLDFGGVAIGESDTLQLTVDNTSTTDVLDIISINVPSSEYVVEPATANIAANGSQIFDVIFTPALAQVYSGDIEFVSANNDLVPVTGFGQEAGPTFSVNPSSLDFGDVAAGGSASQTVTVTNLGASNPMTLSNITSDNAEFTISGTLPATIAPEASEVYTITFTPLGGSQTAQISFESDAPTSPDVLTATGNGVVGSKGTFYFTESPKVRIDKKNYTDSLGLNYIGSEGLHAVEFKFVTNGKIVLDEIRLGDAISNPEDWTFLTNIVRGNLSDDLLTTIDEINVLLYGDGSTVLPAGDYSDLFVFDYYVADISAPDTQLTSIDLIEVYGSVVDGSPVEMVPTAGDTLSQVIEIRNGSIHGSKGDVNGDGTLNLLDILDVVDHILEIDLLTGSKFVKADIAPWDSQGDNIVNVQDLALIQQIILEGKYPDGTTLSGSSAKINTISITDINTLQKNTLDADARVTTYINENGISVILDNNVPVKGVQLEYDQILNLIGDSVDLNTELGRAYFNQVQRSLRVLLYDNNNQVVLNPGKHSLLSVPVKIDELEKVKLEKYIIADLDNQAIDDVEIAYSFEDAPILPVNYSLEQNYPNPFNPSTKIEFSIPEKNTVSLTIYNILGQEVKSLFFGEMERGKMVVNWNGTNNNGAQVPSGLYIVRMNAGSSDFVSSKKMMLLK